MTLNLWPSTRKISGIVLLLCLGMVYPPATFAVDPSIDRSFPMVILNGTLYGISDTRFPKQGVAICGKAVGQSRLVLAQVKASAKSFEVSGCNRKLKEEPWFYISGKMGPLKTGKLPTVERPDLYEAHETHGYIVGNTRGALDAKKRSKQYVFNKTAYQLRFQPGYRVTLQANGTTQTLIQKSGVYNPNAMVMWAGDLDGDKKLDLIMTYSDQTRDSATTLFLSSFAKPGQLVAPVAKSVEDSA